MKDCKVCYGGTPGSAAATTIASMQRVWKAFHNFHEREDGLSHCKDCNGAEGSLPTHCPVTKMTPEQEDAVQAGTLDFTGGRWWMPILPWDSRDERTRFEDAFYAHYLRRRAERNQRGQIGVLDNPHAPHPREMLFGRDDRGEYIAISVQHAWGGWQLARGGL